MPILNRFHIRLPVRCGQKQKNKPPQNPQGTQSFTRSFIRRPDRCRPNEPAQASVFANKSAAHGQAIRHIQGSAAAIFALPVPRAVLFPWLKIISFALSAYGLQSERKGNRYEQSDHDEKDHSGRRRARPAADRLRYAAPTPVIRRLKRFTPKTTAISSSPAKSCCCRAPNATFPTSASSPTARCGG